MGKVVATYQIRVTLRQRDDLPPPGEAAPGAFTSESPPPVPTLDEIKGIVEGAIYTNVDYYTDDEIGVSAERVDS